MEIRQSHIWQTAPNNGWSGWDSLGGVVPRLDPARQRAYLATDDVFQV